MKNIGIISLFLLTAFVYANTLGPSTFIRDDSCIIERNPLLRQWSTLPHLLSSGYWEVVSGRAAPVKEYRPVVMLSYFLTYHWLGHTARVFHIENVLIQALNSILIFLLMRRYYGDEVGLMAAALFAILPIHSEAVAYISGRSELLVLFFMLLSWLALDLSTPHVGLGALSFALALLSKEQAILFPLFLAAADWIFHDVRFWSRQRRATYILLAEVAVFYWLVRHAALGHSLQAGFDYFSGRSYGTRLLTMSRFYIEHYLVPTVTGLAMQFDYQRPIIPDSTLHDSGAWLCLLFWIVLLAGSLYCFLKRRSHSAFWFLVAVLFLLPTGNLIVRLDTIGADRFLYIPSLSYCIVTALAVKSLRSIARKGIATILLIWYAVLSFNLNPVWASNDSYCRAALRTNPYSANCIAQLGFELWHKGKTDAALHLFSQALRLKPTLASAYYNMGCIYSQKGQWIQAKRQFQKALQIVPTDPDSWTCLGVVAERLGDPLVAKQCYVRALDLQDFNPAARYNLAHLLLVSGYPGPARYHFEQFLRVAGDDPKASLVQELLQQNLSPDVHAMDRSASTTSL